jgi:hypothetical protein
MVGWTQMIRLSVAYNNGLVDGRSHETMIL